MSLSREFCMREIVFARSNRYFYEQAVVNVFTLYSVYDLLCLYTLYTELMIVCPYNLLFM